MKKPVFTYWADGSEAFIKKKGICDCCLKEVDEYHISNSQWWYGWKMYLSRRKDSALEKERQGRGDYELHLCYDCIASGTAADKFNLKFNWIVAPSDESVLPFREEVEKRTPGYLKKTKEKWPMHCGEACVYIEGYGCDIDCICHDFQCRKCGQQLSVIERTDYT